MPTFNLRQDLRRGAFTLLELIVVIVVAATLAAVAIPSFQSVKQSTVEQAALIEAAALGREALDVAAFESRSIILTADFTANDLDRRTAEVQQAEDRYTLDAEDRPFWLYTSARSINVAIYPDGRVSLTEGGSQPITIASLGVYCIGQGVNTCTDQRAMYVSWTATEQSSARVTVTPSTSRGGNFQTTANANRELYLGLGELGQQYAVTLTVYRDNSFSDLVSTETITYTVPV